MRVHDIEEKVRTDEQLGPLPLKSERCKYANRMSPAGIPMFYGAFDLDTAIAETYNKEEGEGKVVTAGKFKTVKELIVLDLTMLGSFPSLFDEATRGFRRIHRFLSDFICDLTASVEKDGREHIEYVPTQIVTEYVRYRFKTEEGEKVHGIIYDSARKLGGKCCVLFCSQENCIDIEKDWRGIERWLEIVERSIRQVEFGEDSGKSG